MKMSFFCHPENILVNNFFLQGIEASPKYLILNLDNTFQSNFLYMFIILSFHICSEFWIFFLIFFFDYFPIRFWIFGKMLVLVGVSNEDVIATTFSCSLPIHAYRVRKWWPNHQKSPPCPVIFVGISKGRI